MDEDFKKLRRKKDNQTLVPLYPIPAGVRGTISLRNWWFSSRAELEHLCDPGILSSRKEVQESLPSR